MKKNVSVFGEDVDWIITNPPYYKKLLMPIVEKSINISKKGVAMFMKLTFLETSIRANFLKNNSMLKHVLIFENRQPMYKRGIYTNVGNAISYAWFIWIKDYNGKPVIEWLENSKECKENKKNGVY
jgi:hypothetical protein